MTMNISEIGRKEWIAAPDTTGRTVALRSVLLAICLIAAIFLIAASLPSPADLPDIALMPGPA
jgi:hypothetical protein